MKLIDPSSTGVLLKERRKSLGLTLRAAAQMSGLSFVTLHKIEKGRLKYLHGATVQKLETFKMYSDQLKKPSMMMVPLQPSLDNGVLTSSPKVDSPSPEALKKEIRSGDKEALPPKKLGLKKRLFMALRDWSAEKVAK